MEITSLTRTFHCTPSPKFLICSFFDIAFIWSRFYVRTILVLLRENSRVLVCLVLMNEAVKFDSWNELELIIGLATLVCAKGPLITIINNKLASFSLPVDYRLYFLYEVCAPFANKDFGLPCFFTMFSLQGVLWVVFMFLCVCRKKNMWGNTLKSLTISALCCLWFFWPEE